MGFSLILITMLLLSIINITIASNSKRTGYLALTGKKERVYGQFQHKNSKLNKRDDDNQYLDELLEFGYSQYLVTLKIGSNKEIIRFAVDTGSSDLLVPSIDNEYCIPGTAKSLHEKRIVDESSQYNCSTYGAFNFYDSNTFSWNSSDFRAVFGDGSVANGSWGMDNIYFGNDSIGEFSLGVCDSSTIPVGILGLGFPELESSNLLNGLNQEAYIYENLPQKLVSNGIIHKRVYSLLLDQDHTAKLLFGAIDHSKYTGNLYTFPMVNGYNFVSGSEVLMTAITLNNIDLVIDETLYPIGEGSMSALLDSGTPSSTLPIGMYNKIVDILNLEFNEDNQLYETKCSNIINEKLLRFTFQGVNFDIPLSNFFIRSTSSTNIDDDTCIFVAGKNYFSQSIILGQTFLGQVYMTIDLDEKNIGLAYANLGSIEENQIEVITSGIPSAVNPPLTETYAKTNMLFSSVTDSISMQLSSSINYNTIYVKSILSGGASSVPNLLSTTSTTSSILSTESITTPKPTTMITFTANSPASSTPTTNRISVSTYSTVITTSTTEDSGVILTMVSTPYSIRSIVHSNGSFRNINASFMALMCGIFSIFLV